MHDRHESLVQKRGAMMHMINSDLLLPQAGMHEQWGGVVPRLAQEGHKKVRSFHVFMRWRGTWCAGTLAVFMEHLKHIEDLQAL